MRVLLSAQDLRHSFASRPLFEGLNFTIFEGEKIALIGPNGAGKSTLLKMLAGEVRPDSGNLTRSRGLKIGYMPQIPSFREGATVREVVLEAVDTSSGDWEAIGAAEEAMSRLGLKSKANSLEDKPVATLSGGLQRKVSLARELARGPDLLLLDEPTNHLDLESILWLEDYVRSAPYAVMTISHDRAFLRGVGRRVIEVDRRNPGGILSVNGGYDEFLATKETYLATLASRTASLENTLKREIEWLRRGAKARTTKQKARIDRAYALGDEVGGLREKARESKVKLEFQTLEGGPKRLIKAEKISKAYGDKVLFRDLDLLLTRNARLGLIGNNGTGKSTLIKVLTGEEAPDRGEVTRADRLEVAYFEQNRSRLDPEVSVLRSVCPLGETVEFQGRKIHVRSYLDRFNFDARQSDLAVGKLSGGEQSRLLLALLMLEPANLLVLDEPTNDLDIQTLGILEECLDEFPGAVILVSHDRAFMNEVCDEMIGFPEMIRYADMDQWSAALRARRGSAGAAAKESSRDSASTEASSAGPKKKLSYKEQREFEAMESTILGKESELARLTAESTAEENLSNAVKLAKVMGEMAELQSEIDRLYARWSELEDRK
ncbi:MAG: ABC-F family ATP-binding cassette domain-containing protein [Bdellovibrionales bacterium]|nr:ABC-F family ATP-binding cassette domain-containing protein [Bdellovibrionales bacterium]